MQVMIIFTKSAKNLLLPFSWVLTLIVFMLSATLFCGFHLGSSGKAKQLISSITLPESKSDTDDAHVNVISASLANMQSALDGLDWIEWKLTAAALKADLPVDGYDFDIVSESVPPPSSLKEMANMSEENTRQFARRIERLATLASLLNDSAATGDLSALTPVSKGNVSSTFGTRRDPLTGRQRAHQGLDFPATEGTPIKAVAAGIVEKAEWHDEYGNYVDINHGNGFLTRYGHASEILPHEGDWVAKGQVIGKVGSTGRSTGAHLHFETRVAGKPKDPNKYLAKR